ncbi:MAG: DMT family transporter [Bacillota bacterium]
MLTKTRGILLIMIAAVCFGLLPLFATIAYANGFNPITLTLFRFGFGAGLLYTYIRIKGINYRVSKWQFFMLFQAGLIGYGLMMLILVASYNYIPTGLATTLHFVYPIAIMIGSIFIFKEAVDWKSITALIFSVVGIYFLTGFNSLQSLNIFGVSLALVSGVLYAYYVLTIARSSLREVSAFVIAFYISFFNTLILLVVCAFTGDLQLNITYTGFLSILSLSLISGFVGMVAFHAGLKIIQATTASILSTFELITSLLVGVFLLAEVLAWYHILGSMLIIFSVITVTFSEKKAFPLDSP